MRWLVIAAISIRLLAAGVLAFGPWTDTGDELSGWDVERFQAIAAAEGRPWVDHEVEYPPGSVVIIEAVARDDVVTSHRSLVLLSLIVDGAIAATIAKAAGRRAGAWYLLLGLPLVPMGLLRLDLWSVAPAVLAVAALVHRRPGTFALLATLAALIKAWPVLLLAPAVALDRSRAVIWTILTMALSGLAWIAWVGWSLEPISQVLSLRGATGWHLESVPGSLVALLGSAEPELQFNAYRIGTLSTPIVRVGQAITVAATMWLVIGGRRALTRAGTRPADRSGVELAVAATVMAGAVSALLVTAPLLSPQFLLWLTPWAAMAGAGHDAENRWTPPVMAWPVGAATLITGLTLGVYGPARLDGAGAASLLLVRDALLVTTVLVAAGILFLGRDGPLGGIEGGPRRRARSGAGDAAVVKRTLGGPEDPLGDRGTGPGATRSDP